ncbi:MULTISPECIES: ABC transporter substrate-binding protein [Priestia]|uniref:ABC transporter substrate-binding protein n=1 Tax=Priestia megaterium TaxID=1404 RepID=A0AAX6BSP5_PRIMG|nr:MULTISPECIES: extracellular solute-binding protein [Priestia]MDN4634073.1 extracellular solute-binding protein [Sphingomonas sp. PsM26]KLV29996.1 ABC transporter substrate-binding protein [Priestia megaterium]KNH20791.1 ABC transporter substrate-binding protein [Priestia megaterium]MBU8756852.1 extracellular solute-binding protein [Priestia megaterium]MBZ6488481.1 extracellular solute-binding protein [Priestia aryabhattai]
MAFKIKKFTLAASILSASLLLSTACSNESASGNKASSDSKSDKVVIDLFQGKVEIADQLKTLTDQYTKEHPNVTFNIETVGGGADGAAALKAKFASGKAPDIFGNGGYQEAQTWKNKLEDLSDQPWVKDAYDGSLDPMTIDGKVYGQPINLEGYGFTYNKDLFKKAGIKELPKTFSELEAAAKKLKAAGITPFSIGYGEWWVLGTHGLNIPFAYQKDPDAFIKGLNNGTANIEGNERFAQYLKLLDLTVKYGNKNPLTTDYNTQVTKFASGETAMIQQGNWIQPMIDKLNPNMNVGILPMPLSNNKAETDKLAIGVASNWVIYNKAPEADKKAAKDFLNWMVTSDEGKRALVEDFKYVPAFKTIEAKDIGPLGNELVKYLDEGNTLSWEWTKFPDGVIQKFGSNLQEYVGGQKSKKEVLKALDSSWNELKK